MDSMSSSATSITSMRKRSQRTLTIRRTQNSRSCSDRAGVLHSWADGKGGQKVEDTGPLTKKRMETIDDEVTEHALRFIDEAHTSGEPFVLWYNTTGMHFRTHSAEKHRGKSNGQGEYNDVMVAHDEHIGKMLKKLDELGIADDTIVFYSTDNGPHYNSWPDAGITPFRSEKNTNWEGGWRAPAFVRWPARFKAGEVHNDIVSHQDWMPTLLAAAGEPNIAEKLRAGYTVGDKTFKVHLDGFNMLPYFTGEAEKSPRQFFFYISDDGDILALRMGDWKVVLMEQRAKTLACWFEPFVHLRAPKMFHPRRDPFERADENSNTYWDWLLSHGYIMYAMQAVVSKQIKSFAAFPPLRNLPHSTSTRFCESCRRQIAAPITDSRHSIEAAGTPLESRTALLRVGASLSTQGGKSLVWAPNAITRDIRLPAVPTFLQLQLLARLGSDARRT